MYGVHNIKVFNTRFCKNEPERCSGR